MTVNNITDRLYLIDLDQEITGFRKFISSWLYRGTSTTFLVDPGPLYSIETLIDSLAAMSVTSLDYILLTHIHIDHAGGTGQLLESFPEATVICHPKGIEHMVNPQKLWEGSLKILGDIARSYGAIVPIPSDRILSTEQLDTTDGRISVIPTPGHAIHHQSYQFQDWLFVGEAAGVRHVSESGVYARPATPRVFKLEVSLASLDRVIEMRPPRLCLGHYGYVSDPSEFLTAAREQLLVWVETVQQELAKGTEDVVPRIIRQLKQTDRLIQCLEALPSDLRQREDHFIGNSVKGMLHYLQNQS